MEILKYACPQSTDEAFRLIREEHGTAIGGAAWLRTNTKTIALGVDLAGLGLGYVREIGDHIEIGAMTTYRELETNPLLRARFGALFETTVSHVVGVQLRNIITVGGTVAGRYGFPTSTRRSARWAPRRSSIPIRLWTWLSSSKEA